VRAQGVLRGCLRACVCTRVCLHVCMCVRMRARACACVCMCLRTRSGLCALLSLPHGCPCCSKCPPLQRCTLVLVCTSPCKPVQALDSQGFGLCNGGPPAKEKGSQPVPPGTEHVQVPHPAPMPFSTPYQEQKELYSFPSCPPPTGGSTLAVATAVACTCCS